MAAEKRHGCRPESNLSMATHNGRVSSRWLFEDPGREVQKGETGIPSMVVLAQQAAPQNRATGSSTLSAESFLRCEDGEVDRKGRILPPPAEVVAPILQLVSILEEAVLSPLSAKRV